MRILIVHNILNDSRSVSGVLKEYVHMANAWIDAGHQTDFVVARAGWPQFQRLAPRSRLLNSDSLFDGTRWISKTWVSFPAFAYRMLTAHWMRLPVKYDVVYASNPFIVEVYAAMVLASRLNAKFVVKVQHLLAAQTQRKGLINRLLLWSERTSTRLINRRADLLMCLTATVGRDYEKFENSLRLTPRKIVPSGCGVDLSIFEKTNELPKAYDAVVLGRLHELKGVFEIPHVWRRVLTEIPHAKLLVIGEGPHRKRTEELCRELGLAGSIDFTGGISEVEKNHLLARSKLGLSLSYEEGWGLSVTEFLAAGLPVVAYELPVFNEVFPGQLQLVPPHDAAAAAAQVVELLRDDRRRVELGTRGKAFVARYDYRIIAEAELARLQAVCSRQQR